MYFAVLVVFLLIATGRSFSLSKINKHSKSSTSGCSKSTSNKQQRMFSSLASCNILSITAAAAVKTVTTNSNNVITSFLVKLLEGYTELLIKHPYATKILSSAAVGGTGDFIIQIINGKKSSSTNNIFQLVDFRRWIVFTTVAGLYIAPSLHLWFNYLGYLQFPKDFSKFQIAFIQMILDQTFGALIINAGFFYAFEFSNLLFPPYSNGHILNRNFIKLGTQAFRKNIWATMIANWYCWPIINFLNFLFVPLHFRLLVSNFAAVFWNMFLSTIANSKA